MSSSILAGERKWATARKGGMTVLGKVTVPKPLNLPSQRSENHGMDPNVAIVPKGTLSWGSRGSSSSSDAKISSVSSNADGGAVSPHRPSSGGSGTRPSTAGSDRNHEPSGAWGSNSRPSSAAGTHPSNQSTLMSRPKSAETRPSSSQLSRFAEPVVKNPLPWGPDIASERLGVKQDGFSLESGDFPTLGADRVDPMKKNELEDHSRPTSASGTSAQPENNPKSESDVQRGSFGTWRMEDSQGADDSIHPGMDKWQVDSTHYHHANIPPQHYDSWYGPPMNVPHPRAPQFRPPVGPNGFPMEPFSYYRPQMPPPHLTGSLPVPPPGPSPRGPRPKNGDMYRPHVHDPYARPNMPYRPGFYHGPHGSMPFEGYYGPHTAYHNAEHDIPYMGMGTGHHPAYDGYPRPGPPNLGKSHGRGSGYSPSGKTATETDHFEDSHRGKRVLPSHERWSQKMVGENWEDKPEPVKLYPRKGYVPPTGSDEMGVTEHSRKVDFDNRGVPAENFESLTEQRIHTTENTKPDSFEVLGKAKEVKDGWSNKSGKVAYSVTEMPQVRAGVSDSSVAAGTKDLALMQKIEGLNAKIRVSDFKDDEASVTDNSKEQRNRSQVDDDQTIDDRISEGSINASKSLKKSPILGDVPYSRESVQPAGAVPRRLQRDGHGGDNYHGKGKFNSQGSDGWRRKGPHTASLEPSIKSNADYVMASNPSGYNIVAEVFENSLTNQASTKEGETTDLHDESTIIQRVKAKELVKHRALQLQKEEEARLREQKAKAFAKLEELNRRTLAAGESGNHKPGNALAIAQNQGGSEMTEHKFSESDSDVTHVERNTNQPVESVEDSRNLSSEMLKTDISVSEALHLRLCEDSVDHGAEEVTRQTDGGISTFWPSRHEQNQKISPGTSLNGRILGISSEAPKDRIRIGTIDITLPQVPLGETRVKEHAPSTASALVQPAEPQREKNNQGKTRNKLDATSARTISPIKNEEDLSEKIESGSSLSNFDTSIQVEVPSREVSSSSSIDSVNRVSNQLRNQPSRKLPRGQQAYRSAEKLHGNDTVIWAPVRTLTNKAEDSIVSSEESTNRTRVDVKSGNFKGKRADMERYVTKAVVKELSHQETIPAPSMNSFRSNEGSVKEQPPPTVKAENAYSAAGLVSETIRSDGGRYSKHKKEHDGQRHWISAGSSSQTEGGGHLKTGLDKVVELSKEQNETVKGEKLTENSNSSDWAQTSSGVTTAASNNHPPNKDQGMSRGKRQLARGSRPMGFNRTSPESMSKIDIGGVGTDSVSPDVNRTETTIASEDIQKPMELSHSRWKPKSNSASRMSVAAEVHQQLADKDHHEAKADKVPKHEKKIDESVQAETVPSKAADGSIAPSHREFSKDKKPLAQSKSTPFPPNHDSAEDQLLHDASSGFNKHRSQNNRSFRGGHDFRANHPPQLFRERQRQNTHYEYQPVDPSKSTKPTTENPPPEGAESSNRRYHQDRAPKRGGSHYRQQSGAARVGSGHD